MKNLCYKFKKTYSSVSNKNGIFVSVILCVLLSFVSIFSFNIIPFADSKSYWNDNMQGSTPNKVRDVYQISNPKELAFLFFSILPKASSSATIKACLKNDIDLSEHYWSQSTANCNLEFYGDSHYIFNLKNSNDNYGGLLSNHLGNGYVTFTNLAVQGDYTISATLALGYGLFVGYSSGTVNIDSCIAMGKILISAKSESVNIGGFVGLAKDFYVKKSQNSVTISGRNDYLVNSVGGFVGKTTSTCKFELCSNFGDVAGGILYAGGLVGYACGLNLKTAKSYNSANISSYYSKSKTTGPIFIPKLSVSYIYGNGVSSPVITTTTVKTGYAGGLVGYVSSVGNSTISYVYNNQKITSNGYAGGIVGDTEVSLSFSNIYNSGDVVATKNISGSSSSTGSVTSSWSTTEKYSEYFPNKDNNKKYTIHFDGYTTDYRYSGGAKDVSVVGNDSKISSKSSTYTIKPSCISSSSSSGQEITDFKFTFNISLKDTSGNKLYSATANTSYFSSISSMKTAVLSYYNQNYSEVFDKIYYVDALFNNSIKVDLNYQMKDEGEYIFTYLKNVNALYLYTVLDKEKQDYQKNGLPIYYSDKINNMLGNFGSYDSYVEYIGARIYICHYNEDYVYDDDIYNIYIFPLFRATYERGGGVKGTVDLPAVKGWFDHNLRYADFDLTDDAWANMKGGVKYYSVDNIKSASFDGDVFGVKSSINGGLPVFKEMYWEFG